MGQKVSEYEQDIELGKQRENKLMFFLYVLKEERNCPVSEVFEKFIKPIETRRFSADYGVDFRDVLENMKKRDKTEKMYSKAVKKIKLVEGNRDYKSDSCLPSNKK